MKGGATGTSSDLGALSRELRGAPKAGAPLELLLGGGYVLPFTCTHFPGMPCPCVASHFPLFFLGIFFLGWFRAIHGDEDYNVHFRTEAHAQDAILKCS